MEFGDTTQWWFVLAYGLIVFGLVGAVVPVLPGPMLIWLGAFIFAWADGFARLAG